MSTSTASTFWQKVLATSASTPERPSHSSIARTRRWQGMAVVWMAFDVLTILVSAMAATSIERRLGWGAYSGSLRLAADPHSGAFGDLLITLAGFALALIATSQQLELYIPKRFSSALLEQRRSMQACLTAGLLLMGALYLFRVVDVSQSVVLITLGFVTVLLSLRRLGVRYVLYRDYDRGIGVRNALIVGTGPEAIALRNHLERIPHLGYRFKGFIEVPGGCNRSCTNAQDVVGSLDSLFQQTRQHFVDEVFFTAGCEQRGAVKDVVVQARLHGVDLRVVPDLYDGFAWNSPVEYIGQFPTIPLHTGQIPEFALILKRLIDVVFSATVLVLISPLLLVLAVAVKLDSPGPVFYWSDRLGKKGRVFRCVKFRTMVQDAELRREELMHMNERDGVLFKMSNDPRITRLGRILRKYSLDELPQFFNVLHGDMSVVGPRPPLASEVREYQLGHLRRLDVTPGITGLWQVQSRQDPSFDSYISLDLAYIENWSVWLDIKIILRTIGVIFEGTGS